MQHRVRVTAAHALNQFDRSVVLLNQLLKRFTRQCRRIGIHVQFRAIHRQCHLVLVHRIFIFDVLLLFAFLHFVEWWLSNVDITTLNQLRHLAVEEGQQQSTNVRAVDVRIGHDDDVVITQFIWVVLIAANTTAKSGDQRRDFL